MDKDDKEDQTDSDDATKGTDDELSRPAGHKKPDDETESTELKDRGDQQKQKDEEPIADAQEDTASSQDKEVPATSLWQELSSAANSLQKKLSLSKAEQIALGALALIFVGLIIWACIWLSGQNDRDDLAVELPARGKYVTITDISTIWVAPPKGTGMNPYAVVVPSASITLDPDSVGKAALRIYFQNTTREIVGDPMTVTVEDGKFPHGSNHLEVIATDGFHSEGEFFSYQDGDSKLWRLVVLEAKDESVSGSEFNKLVDAPVGTNRK